MAVGVDAALGRWIGDPSSSLIDEGVGEKNRGAPRMGEWVGELLEACFSVFSPKNATGDAIGELLDLLL